MLGPRKGFGQDAVEAAVLSPQDGSDDADLRLLGKAELAVELVRRVSNLLASNGSKTGSAA